MANPFRFLRPRPRVQTIDFSTLPRHVELVPGAQSPEGGRGVLIAVPHLEPFQGWFVDRLMSMERPANSGFARVERKPLDAARTSLARYAVDMGFSHVFFLDSDMIVPYDIIPRLLAMDTPIASGLYFARADPSVPHAYYFQTADDEGMRWYRPVGKLLAEYIRDNPVLLDPRTNNVTTLPDRCFPVDAIGFGCVLIQTAALREIPEPWFSIDINGGGEDFHFCEQAALVGLQPVVNFGLMCNHEIRPVHTGRNEWVETWGVGTEDEFDWDHEGPIEFSVGPAGKRRMMPVIKDEVVELGGSAVPSAQEVA